MVFWTSFEKIYNYLIDKNSGILEDNDYKDDKDEKIVSLEKFRNKRKKAAPHKHNKEFVKLFSELGNSRNILGKLFN